MCDALAGLDSGGSKLGVEPASRVFGIRNLSKRRFRLARKRSDDDMSNRLSRVQEIDLGRLDEPEAPAVGGDRERSLSFELSLDHRYELLLAIADMKLLSQLVSEPKLIVGVRFAACHQRKEE